MPHGISCSFITTTDAVLRRYEQKSDSKQQIYYVDCIVYSYGMDKNSSTFKSRAFYFKMARNINIA